MGESLKLKNTSMTNQGALSVRSGAHTGRCPEAKRIVKDSFTEATVDWSANQAMTPEEWELLWQKAESYMVTWKDYGRDFPTVTAAAGKITKWESRTRKVFNFICENTVQAHFVQNMFEECTSKPDQIECEVFCMPSIDENPIVAINFAERKIIITGTSYLGEIKKSVFTYMNYILTDTQILPMHCSVNVDKDLKNPTIFFGLSGTGKTTLSSSPDRYLLGDDEHGWTDNVLFNIESGCYAKTIDLTPDSEPEIYRAVNRFGSIIENVPTTNGDPDFFDTSITKNGRASYPISHLERHVTTGRVFEDPVNIVMLTCDAFGVLPAVSRLTSEEARRMFLTGYTSKVAGTEVGVEEPVATFSACFGAPFLPRPPQVYGDLLKSFLDRKDINCWLVNTGWSGGSFGVGERMKLSDTRAVVNAITNGSLSGVEAKRHEYTGFMIPESIPGLEEFETQPEMSWKKVTDYKRAAKKLMALIEKESSKFV